MNREWAIVSPRPVSMAECIVGAASVDPDLGVADLWDGGAAFVSRIGAQTHLTVTRSRALEHTGDAERILGGPVPVPGDEHELYWTDLHACGWHVEEDAALVGAIAAAADGSAHALTGEVEEGSDDELQH
ncbi:hypothetical protein BFL36_01210 [Clavibacter michiganensis]|uniref:Uncharacterized protein n=1 Tax=Clavibacter michiganensis TaxID=28447 RepID=A0A251YXJ8_9MICO|nr:hypothetical protein [Clavibacter michiganensis]OUE28863.1 hypothetical protein BFL36_01210 [Clavibacter michiganensis]